MITIFSTPFIRPLCFAVKANSPQNSKSSLRMREFFFILFFLLSSFFFLFLILFLFFFSAERVRRRTISSLWVCTRCSRRRCARSRQRSLLQRSILKRIRNSASRSAILLVLYPFQSPLDRCFFSFYRFHILSFSFSPRIAGGARSIESAAKARQQTSGEDGQVHALGSAHSHLPRRRRRGTFGLFYI